MSRPWGVTEWGSSHMCTGMLACCTIDDMALWGMTGGDTSGVGQRGGHCERIHPGAHRHAQAPCAGVPPPRRLEGESLGFDT